MGDNLNMQFSAILATFAATASVSSAFSFTAKNSFVRNTRAKRTSALQMSTGLYFSTSTGNTETVGGYIAAETGLELTDIGDADDGDIAGHDSLIVGAPTWNTGADEQRSGTSWDDWLYDNLPNIDVSGKKVAIFAVGDQASYNDNYCDAAGELYDLFTAAGAKVYGNFNGWI